jgi:phosphatidylethanolamine/phosphatidyl-N-methylethanolamine N-methyltransferase
MGQHFHQNMSRETFATTWNRWRYSLYGPIYDPVARLFTAYRRRSLEGLDLRAGEKVLLIGAGTGLDLEWMPTGLHITATDLTPVMVERLKRRSERLGLPVAARVMDGQALDFPDGQFDVVILHLILAVIPDPLACIREAERVLRPGGRIGVMDKFLPPGQSASPVRKLLNGLTRLLATSINRRWEDLLAHTGLEMVSDEPVGLSGNFRVIRLRKAED